MAFAAVAALAAFLFLCSAGFYLGLASKLCGSSPGVPAAHRLPIPFGLWLLPSIVLSHSNRLTALTASLQKPLQDRLAANTFFVSRAHCEKQ